MYQPPSTNGSADNSGWIRSPLDDLISSLQTRTTDQYLASSAATAGFSAVGRSTNPSATSTVAPSAAGAAAALSAVASAAASRQRSPSLGNSNAGTPLGTRSVDPRTKPPGDSLRASQGGTPGSSYGGLGITPQVPGALGLSLRSAVPTRAANGIASASRASMASNGGRSPPTDFTSTWPAATFRGFAGKSLSETTTAEGASAMHGGSSSSTGADAALSPVENRITQVEEEIKGLNAILKEQQQNPDGALALRERVQCLALAVETARGNRKVFEKRIDRLREQLTQERDQREAWLTAFLAALKKTLDELTSCIDQSVMDSSKLMCGRLDEAESMMAKLILRMDSAFGPTTSSSSTTSKLQAPDVTSKRLAGGAPASRMAATAPASMVHSLRGSPVVSRTASQTRLHTEATSSESNPVEHSQAANVQEKDGRDSATVEGGMRNSDSESDLAAAAAAAASANGEDQADILRSWTGLLNENLRLQKQQTELRTRRQILGADASRSRASRSAGGSPYGVRSLNSPVTSPPVSSYPPGTRPMSRQPALPAVPER